jgi:hypothetical protein
MLPNFPLHPEKRIASLQLWYISFEAKARGANLPLDDVVHAKETQYFPALWQGPRSIPKSMRRNKRSQLQTSSEN